MTQRALPPEAKRALVRAAALDAVCVFGGLGLFMATGNWIWLVSGVLLGAGFLVPALITAMRSRR
jgi:hypothetical protein